MQPTPQKHFCYGKSVVVKMLLDNLKGSKNVKVIMLEHRMAKILVYQITNLFTSHRPSLTQVTKDLLVGIRCSKFES